MPKKVPIKVEMTKPSSKLHYKITYPNGNEKWVREKPGHKSEKWKIREKKRMLKLHPEIVDFFKKLEPVVNQYMQGEATDEDITKVVRDFETTAGWNKARMVVRRLMRSEKVKMEKAKKEDIDMDYHKGVIKALAVAVDFVARRSRDKRKKAVEGSGRLERIARMLGLSWCVEASCGPNGGLPESNRSNLKRF